jgi:tryptophan halogenase
MGAQPIRSVVIAGGGIVGWSAACALKRQLPMLDVAVAASEPPANALADRMVPTLPSIVEFHRDLGLTEADTVVRANSGLRLGTRFGGWSADGADYVHAYGQYGRQIGPSAFHQHWLRTAGEADAFDSYSAAAAVGGAGRFAHPRDASEPLLPPFAHGLHIDPARYREMMRAYALHLGVAERTGEVADVRLRGEDGFVQALVLGNGEQVEGDLFVDATGPAATVRSRLDKRREDWSKWLPADRILFADGAPSAEPQPLDRCVAVEAGWRWEVRSPARISHGLVYSSRYLSDSKAARLLHEAAGFEPPGDPATIDAGRLVEPWVRNCVAIGDAAVSVEPLEWTNLHLAHSAIDRLVAMLPDRDCSAVELSDYNRQCVAEADRVRDFLILHYAVAQRPRHGIWCDAAAVEPPASLAHMLTQFRERGRLPFYEEETFARDSWAAILLGQGVIPRRIDPLIDAVPEEETRDAMAKLRRSIDALVQAAPPLPQYLQQLRTQAGR